MVISSGYFINICKVCYKNHEPKMYAEKETEPEYCECGNQVQGEGKNVMFKIVWRKQTYEDSKLVESKATIYIDGKKVDKNEPNAETSDIATTDSDTSRT